MALKEQLVAGLDLDVAHAGIDAAHAGAKDVKSPQAYLAYGRLSSKGLEIFHLKQGAFGNLARELGEEKFSAAALDFPFSMPAEFIEYCAQKATRVDFQSWQEYVEYLFSVDLQQFVTLVNEFKNEPLRSTDMQKGLMTLSPLHKENPNMVELTYVGVRNLASLDPGKFCILPFHDVHEGLCSVLEVNSQGALTALKLLKQMPVKQVAGAKQVTASAALNNDGGVPEQRELRQKVIENMLEMKTNSPLTFKEHPDLFINQDVKSACVESVHALDAVTACYMAALWVNTPSLFDDPYEGGDEKVLLEGWAYVPHSV